MNRIFDDSTIEIFAFKGNVIFDYILREQKNRIDKTNFIFITLPFNLSLIFYSVLKSTVLEFTLKSFNSFY